MKGRTEFEPISRTHVQVPKNQRKTNTEMIISFVEVGTHFDEKPSLKVLFEKFEGYRLNNNDNKTRDPIVVICPLAYDDCPFIKTQNCSIDEYVITILLSIGVSSFILSQGRSDVSNQGRQGRHLGGRDRSANLTSNTYKF